jgi:hypothetical protein
MKFIALLITVFCLLSLDVSPVRAAAEIGLLDNLSFSKDVFYVGDTVRIYATIRNNGDQDVSGTVMFYKGTEALTNGVQFSLRKDGYKEEVFADFVIPEGTFNIRAEITETNPVDTDLSNNSILTGMFTPILDSDHDGVADTSDNCKTVSNSDQKDMDGDGLGNLCDDDIDGDGWTNSVEQEKGTDPLNKDTDGDGINDPNDKTPLGEPLVVPKPEVKKEAPVSIFENLLLGEPGDEGEETDIADESVQVDSNDSSDVISSDENVELEQEQLQEIVAVSSRNASFTFEETRWATYNFRIVGPSKDDGYRYEWSFGDDTTSNRRDVTHYYGRSGSFVVLLRMTDPDGVVTEDSVDVHVAFFDLQNRSIRMLIVFLTVMVLIGVSAFYRIGREQNE